MNVYRLITKGTIEEKVMSYQKFKKNTADVSDERDKERGDPFQFRL